MDRERILSIGEPDRLVAIHIYKYFCAYLEVNDTIEQTTRELFFDELGSEVGNFLN